MALLDTMGLRRLPGTILPLVSQLYVSGAPLMGLEAMRLIPDNCYILAHVPAGFTLDGFRVFTIKRDPRNVLVSYCRHRKREEAIELSLSAAMDDFWGQPFVPTYAGYLGWAGRSAMFRYEDLPAAVVGNGDGIYARQPKNWNTRTGRPSRWQDVWTDEIEAAWQAHGGPKLLEDAGYA